MPNTWLKGRRTQWGPFQCELHRHVNSCHDDKSSRRVKGKLPGNIDLIIRAIANQRGGYVHDTLLEWFEEYQSTTINIRLLGVDKVRSSSSFSGTGGPLTTNAVLHYGFRAPQVPAGNWSHELLPGRYTEGAAVSAS